MLYPDSGFSGRAGFSDLDPFDGGWLLNPMGTVLHFAHCCPLNPAADPEISKIKKSTKRGYKSLQREQSIKTEL